MKPFSVLKKQQIEDTIAPIVAIDIGYSSTERSCGVAWTGHKEAWALQFGEAIRQTGKLLASFDWKAVLVIEAPLSTFHHENGNPGIRGEFEKGRGWYYGGGVLTFAAAIRFLQRLARLCPEDLAISLAEAFLSNKGKASSHVEDAAVIHDNFWAKEPQDLAKNLEPASALIKGVPPVRVFEN